VRVLLTASTGGHLHQLAALRPWWSEHERLWVTFDQPDAWAVLAGETVTRAHHPTTRNLPNLVRNFGVAWKTLRRFRPDVVVSTGAAIAVPFFYLAKGMGIRTVYVEVYDRIDSPTLTARLCQPFTDLFCVQWPEQQRFYRNSVVVGRFL
jgi:UDP-N-acetylglucosamine:LPS N-acetylglucosamine transferase